MTHQRPRNHLLAALPIEDYSRLAPHLTVQLFPRGYVLHQRDEPLRLAYFPDESLSWLISPTEDGSHTQVAMIGREGMIGIEAVFGSSVAMCDAVVQTMGERTGYAMSLDVFHREMDRRGAFYSIARRYANALVVSLIRCVACNASHSAEERCCRWLLEAAFRLDRPEVPVTHELLSDLLGLRRSTVTLILRRLHDHGVISAQRGLVRIADQEALEQKSCECHKLVRELFDPKSSSQMVSAEESLVGSH
jgi:CRP-like cAMP-binding protein